MQVERMEISASMALPKPPGDGPFCPVASRVSDAQVFFVQIAVFDLDLAPCFPGEAAKRQMAFP